MIYLIYYLPLWQKCLRKKLSSLESPSQVNWILGWREFMYLRNSFTWFLLTGLLSTFKHEKNVVDISELFFIDNCIKFFFLDKLFIERNISGAVTKKKEVFICLEFLGKISLQSKKQLTEIFRTCQKYIKLNVVFQSSNKIRNAFRFKDQIPKYTNSKIFYKFKCNICNDVYFGETKHHFLVHEYEHLGKSILTEKNLKYTGERCYYHTSDTSCFSSVGNAANKYCST